MVILFHGTSEANSKEIFLSGFKEGTYFAKHLEDAIEYGGPYVFWVFFEHLDQKKLGWEYIIDTPVQPDKIVKMIVYSKEISYNNEDLQYYMRKVAIKEQHGIQADICEPCKGRGQLSVNPEPLIACSFCRGFGYISNKQNV